MVKTKKKSYIELHFCGTIVVKYLENALPKAFIKFYWQQNSKIHTNGDPTMYETPDIIIGQHQAYCTEMYMTRLPTSVAHFLSVNSAQGLGLSRC